MDFAYAQNTKSTYLSDEKERNEYEAMVLKDYEYTERDYEIMVGYFKKCQNDGTSTYYDCECLASNYVKKKVVYDDQMTDYVIFQQISKQCVDDVAVAGQTYSECISMQKVDPRWSDEFCECYANEYAEEYKEKGLSLNRRQIVKVRGEAMNKCNFLGNFLIEKEEERKARANALAERARQRLEQQQ